MREREMDSVCGSVWERQVVYVRERKGERERECVCV